MMSAMASHQGTLGVALRFQSAILKRAHDLVGFARSDVVGEHVARLRLAFYRETKF
jgi:hypothetical protein